MVFHFIIYLLYVLLIIDIETGAACPQGATLFEVQRVINLFLDFFDSFVSHCMNSFELGNFIQIVLNLVFILTFLGMCHLFNLILALSQKSCEIFLLVRLLAFL